MTYPSDGPVPSTRTADGTPPYDPRLADGTPPYDPRLAGSKFTSDYLILFNNLAQRPLVPYRPAGTFK